MPQIRFTLDKKQVHGIMPKPYNAQLGRIVTTMFSYMILTILGGGCTLDSPGINDSNEDSANTESTDTEAGILYCPSQYGGPQVDRIGAHCLCGELPNELASLGPVTDAELLQRLQIRSRCGYEELTFCKDRSFIIHFESNGIAPLDNVRPVGVGFESATRMYVFSAATRELAAWGYVPDDDDSPSCDVGWYGDVDALSCFDEAVVRLRTRFAECADNRPTEECPVCTCRYDTVLNSLDCEQ